MEPQPSQVAKVRAERYAQWERTAPATCAALVVAASVAAYTYRPNLFVVAGPFIGGLAFFFSWRAALLDRHNVALVHALVGVVVAMSGVVFAGEVGAIVMFSQSFPWLGLGMFLPIWFSRRCSPAP